MMRLRIRLMVLVLAWGFFLAGCDSMRSVSFARLIAERSTHRDCNIWVEADGMHSTFLRAGYAGACSELSISNYARHLGEIFDEHGINKTNYKSVAVIYVNSYQTDGVLNREMACAIDSLDNGNLVKLNNCDGPSLDSWFGYLNKTSNLLHPIYAVIEKNFSPINGVEFNGILPYVNKERRAGKCYPDSFGVATYRLNP